MASKLYSAFMGLPPAGKVAVFVGGGIVITVGIYALIQKIKSDAAKAQAQQTITNTSADLGSWKQQGGKLSYPLSQYDLYSDALASAFGGWGTDNDQVYNIFKNMKNKGDVLQLIVSFGVKTIPAGTGNPAPNFSGTLSAVIYDEMSASEISKVNDTLKTNGVDYKF